MTLTYIYATAILPGLLAWTTLWLNAHMELNDLLSLAASVAVFLASSFCGHEVEHYYFREVCKGKGKLVRLFTFVFGLPAIYALSVLPALGIYFFFPELPLPILVTPSLLT